MRRFSAFAFAALVAASLGAFFLTQHLKVTSSLIVFGQPEPPSINPVASGVCEFHGKPISFRKTRISFYLPFHSDTVHVSIVRQYDDLAVKTFAWRSMTLGKPATFVWNGREHDGRAAPRGPYYVQIVLQHEGRTEPMTSHEINVFTRPITSSVVSVSAPSPTGQVTVHFTPKHYRAATLLIYRVLASGRLMQVGTEQVRSTQGGVATWNGQINGRPAPAGSYLIGLQLTDVACVTSRSPATNPPSALAARRAGLTISYLSVEPQLTPVPAGAETAITVNSRGQPYSWELERARHAQVLLRGQRRGSSTLLKVRLPAGAPGLYRLTVTSGGHHVTVPVIASAPAAGDQRLTGSPSANDHAQTGSLSANAPVLVVLPALTWEGENPVKDGSSGLPDTLVAGDQIELNRPLVSGLPAGFEAQAALLSYLKRAGLRYQLTTDVALAQGAGPPLAGRSGVILDGSFRWIPTSVAGALREFASSGGRVLAIGTHSLQAQAPLRSAAPRSTAGPTAGPPVALEVDPFGARHGPVLSTGGTAISPITDPLDLFGSVGVLSGFNSYQQILPPTGAVASIAGVSSTSPAITGFRFGQGDVVEIALPRFAMRLSDDISARELFTRAWQLLS